MGRNKLLYTIFGLVILIILIYSFAGNFNQENYLQEVLDKRAEIDQFMRSSDDSPFQTVEEPYQGLNYYDPNPDYRINADFTKIDSGKVRRLPTSDGKEEMYREYGFADFMLNGREHRLLVLEMVGGINHIFIPFADSTSGEDTYGAGRYLELPTIRNGKILLDFNYSYNPYCAYSASYSCPLPPAENYLATSILAGEKNYD
jgi:uncharacterized protein (DUF1684 family)